MSSEVAIGRLMKGSEMFIRLAGTGSGRSVSDERELDPAENHLAAVGTHLGLCAIGLIGSRGSLAALTISTRAT